jgi:hypothetical protein
LNVGFPAVKAIVGNKLLPSYADRKLARTGYSGQMGSQPVPDDRPDNLFDPVGADYGTHGRFDGRAKSFSGQLWLTTHRGLVAASTLAAAAMLWRTRRR